VQLHCYSHGSWIHCGIEHNKKFNYFLNNTTKQITFYIPKIFVLISTLYKTSNNLLHLQIIFIKRNLLHEIQCFKLSRTFHANINILSKQKVVWIAVYFYKNAGGLQA